MKITSLLLALAFACAFAVEDTVDSRGVLASWSGTTAQSPLWYPANPSLNPCAVSTSVSNYAVVNYTFATAGTRQVGLVAERGFSAFVQVFLYKTAFTPSTQAASPNSCSNFQRTLDNKNIASDLGIMKINEPTYFEANVPYFFVITANAANRAGRFSLTIFGSKDMGTTSGGPQWYPSTTNTGACLNDTSSGLQFLATYTWQQTASGFFDVLALFATETANTGSNKVYITLTTGNFSTAQIAAAPCSVTGGALIVTSQNGDTMTPIYRVALTKDAIYTISVSNVVAGYYGIQVIPSRSQSVASTTFAQPNRNLPCSANSTATTAGFFLFSFVAKYDQVFVDTASLPSWFTTIRSFRNWAFVYSGANVGPVSCPSTAPLIAANTTEIEGAIVFSTVVGREYDIVFSTASGASSVNGDGLQIFFFEGQWAGNRAAYVPDTSFTTSTGAAATTTTATTATGPAINATTSTSSGATSNNAATTSAAAATTGQPAETSSASAIAVSAILLVAVAALL